MRQRLPPQTWRVAPRLACFGRLTSGAPCLDLSHFSLCSVRDGRVPADWLRLKRFLKWMRFEGWFAELRIQLRQLTQHLPSLLPVSLRITNGQQRNFQS